jgi:hypothetical protein
MCIGILLPCLQQLEDQDEHELVLFRFIYISGFCQWISILALALREGVNQA